MSGRDAPRTTAQGTAPLARFRTLALWLGLLVGVTAALLSLREPPPGVLPPEAAAIVDGAVVPRDRYLRTLATFAVRDRAPALDEAQRRRLLDELIAEELLLGHAAALDLPRRDPLLRRRVVTQLLADITAEARLEPVTEAQLRRFFAENGGRFAARPRYEVQSIWFRGATGSRARVEEARRALVAGAPFATVAATGDRPPVALPTGALAASALREYLGPTAARQILALAPGTWSAPIRVTGGHRLVRVVAVHERPAPGFDEVRDSVRTMLVRQREAVAVERYVAELRATAAVRIDESLLSADFAIPPAYLDEARAPGAEPGKR